MLSLSVFIFAYNEEKSMEAATREISGMLEETGRLYELIIIDDGSSDATGEIADKLAREIKRLSVIHHEKNLGLGSVYKTAFANAKYDLVTFFCADGQFPPEITRQFLPLMEKMDMVLGYLARRTDSLFARTLSGVEKILFRILFGPMPKFQGALMFKRKLLMECELKSGGGKAWTILMELIIRASRGGYKVTSVPINMRLRLSGASKVNNLSTIWVNLKEAFTLWRRL